MTIIYSAGSITRNGFIVFQMIPFGVVPIKRSNKIIRANIPIANKIATKNCFNNFTFNPIMFIVLIP